jgi:hypothetical protein
MPTRRNPRHRPLRPPPSGPLHRLRRRPPGPGLQARSTRKHDTRHPPRRSPTRRRPHRTVRLTPGMRCAIPGHHHPQYRQEHHPEDHLLGGPPPLMPGQPPDSSNCRDQEQGNDHALIVAAVTGPCKPPLRRWMRPERRASAPERTRRGHHWPPAPPRASAWRILRAPPSCLRNCMRPGPATRRVAGPQPRRPGVPRRESAAGRRPAADGRWPAGPPTRGCLS